MKCGLLFIIAVHLCIFTKAGDSVIVKLCVTDNRVSPQWKDAILHRVSKNVFDSIISVKRELNSAEAAWQQLILSKKEKWNTIRDSIGVPFAGIELSSTIFVMLGCHGEDDGFTYKQQSVCLDLSALQKNYGAATLPENNARIDRIFAHEYTHLLHKEWARKNKLQLKTFADNILWECIYEGIGMYRSLSAKWLPVNGSLPAITNETMNELTPIFIQKINKIIASSTLTIQEKDMLQSNLSRGPVTKKWGAFPVAIWLLLEAKGYERNLIPVLDKGLAAVPYLANKYLPQSPFLTVAGY